MNNHNPPHQKNQEMKFIIEIMIFIAPHLNAISILFFTKKIGPEECQGLAITPFALLYHRIKQKKQNKIREIISQQSNIFLKK
jgi:hypothetical protein